MEQPRVTTVEQNRDDVNSRSQETLCRKPRTEQCGTQHKPQEFGLRINEALEEGNQPNRHPLFFKHIIPFQQRGDPSVSDGSSSVTTQILHTVNQVTFPVGLFQCTTQSLHTFSHVVRNNPLLVHTSTMNPHPSNITSV
jgi:hypothetical protein